MSERKTTEIKLRVTPAEKMSWQLDAEEEGIGLSELVRREMNNRARQKAGVVVYDFTPPGGAFATSDAEGEDSSVAPCKAFWKGCPDGECVCGGDGFGVHYDPTPQTDVQPVGTSGEVDLVSSEPKPWTFEARNRD